MLSPEDRIYRFLWPEKLLQRYSLYSIYRYIKDSEVFFSKKNAYLLLKILYAITSNIVFFPISIVLYTFNYKFIYGTMLFQIGEVFSLDIAVKKNILYSNSKLILFFYPPLHDNSYLLSQFDENIIIIRNRFLFLLLMPLSHSILTKIDIVNYDTNCGGGECFMADIANRYQDKFESPLLKLPSKDIVNGYKVINKYIDKEIKIVCVHARESGYREGFYKDENRTTRNSDIATYESLFDELTLLGYVIVRIGDSSMTKCDNFVRKYGNSFIDYAHMDIKSEEMDVFLLSECDFFIACTSGPAEVPSMFGKNTLLLNGYPLVSSLLTRKGDISIFKKIIDTNTKKNIVLNKYFQHPFDKGVQLHFLQDTGYDLVDNTSEEILNAFYDFMSIRAGDGFDDNYSFNVNKYCKKGHKCNKIRGKISKSFINSYIKNQENEVVDVK